MFYFYVVLSQGGAGLGSILPTGGRGSLSAPPSPEFCWLGPPSPGILTIYYHNMNIFKLKMRSDYKPTVLA